METYITICKIDSQWEFAICLGKPKQGLCINLEGWGGERDGREVPEGGDICISMADWASLIAQLVKNLPEMQETPVQFLAQEDPREKG